MSAIQSWADLDAAAAEHVRRHLDKLGWNLVRAGGHRWAAQRRRPYPYPPTVTAMHVERLIEQVEAHEAKVCKRCESTCDDDCEP